MAIPTNMRRRAATLPPRFRRGGRSDTRAECHPTATRPPRAYTRPEPDWRVGHYDGPTDPAGRREEARYLATGIVAPIYRNNPGACHSLLLKAQALDIPESTALENIYWHQAIGKGAVSAQLMAALLHRHGYVYEVTVETTERVSMTWYKMVKGSTGKLRRRKLGESTWTILEAIGAGLAWREQWRHYPTDMLWARCLMRGARRHASKVGTGLAYTLEEIADMASPAEGSEVSAAVQEILEKATTAGTTADEIRNDLVKDAGRRKLLEADTGDGTPLGYVLGMLWGEARARETDAIQAAAPAAPPAPAEPDDVGAGPLTCGCPAAETFRTGKHQDGCHE